MDEFENTPVEINTGDNGIVSTQTPIDRNIISTNPISTGGLPPLELPDYQQGQEFEIPINAPTGPVPMMSGTWEFIQRNSILQSTNNDSKYNLSNINHFYKFQNSSIINQNIQIPIEEKNNIQQSVILNESGPKNDFRFLLGPDRSHKCQKCEIRNAACYYNNNNKNITEDCLIKFYLNYGLGETRYVDIREFRRKLIRKLFCAKSYDEVKQLYDNYLKDVIDLINKSNIIPSEKYPDKKRDIENFNRQINEIKNIIVNERNLALTPDSLIYYSNVTGKRDECCLCGGKTPTTCCYPNSDSDYCICPDSSNKNLCQDDCQLYYNIVPIEGKKFKSSNRNCNLENWYFMTKEWDISYTVKDLDDNVILKREMLNLYDRFRSRFVKLYDDEHCFWVEIPTSYEKVKVQIKIYGLCGCCFSFERERPTWISEEFEIDINEEVNFHDWAHHIVFNYKECVKC